MKVTIQGRDDLRSFDLHLKLDDDGSVSFHRNLMVSMGGYKYDTEIAMKRAGKDESSDNKEWWYLRESGNDILYQVRARNEVEAVVVWYRGCVDAKQFSDDEIINFYWKGDLPIVQAYKEVVTIG